ncbi:hypothetical protein I3843_11G039900 [Carya illinoinensis]|uniref:Transmembrane protein n=1 Tax=Carya illinoinensis TaxID=32201 RepID=A0A922DM64_CARIL|nr:hypothetical protein I3842_11G039800 [Carya illinoinensis]KAG7954825.1 hypothetical protein I3843_11G039900 [Carya illinoinensis]
MALRFSTTVVMFCFIAFLILANHIVSPRQLISSPKVARGFVEGTPSPITHPCTAQGCFPPH